jgi:Tol biopolymer transport system component
MQPLGQLHALIIAVVVELSLVVAQSVQAAVPILLQQVTQSYSCDYPLEYAAFSADGNHLAYFPNNCTDSNLRVVDIPFDGSEAVITRHEFKGFNPVMSEDGRRIAFYSRYPRTSADVETADIVIYDPVTRSVVQRIKGVGGSAGLYYPPAMSAKGNRIAFQSKKNPAGKNSDGNYEIFLYDTDTNTLTQITQTVTQDIGNLDPAISGDGSKISFSSAARLAGMTNNHHEIMMYDVDTKTFTQVTRTKADNGTHYSITSNEDSSLNDDGSFIAFTSNGNLTGKNPDGSREVFLYDSTRHTFTQLSNSFFSDTAKNPGGSGCSAISGSGNRVAYFSTENTTGENTDGGSEIFVFDVTSQSVAQVTHSRSNLTSLNVNGFPTFSRDGSRLLFSSVFNLTGGGERPNLFIAWFSLVKGDMNHDGQINLADVRILLQMVVGVISPSVVRKYIGDVFPREEAKQGDGRILTEDVGALLRQVMTG